MANVTPITPHLTTITAPDGLRALPGWLVWRYESEAGEAKPRKVPYYANGSRRHGLQGRPEDRQQLVNLDAAKRAAAKRGMDGVGLALLPEFGIVALDFDRCVGSGGINPEVERLVAGTYAEFSPSGQGIRAFFRGDLGNHKSHAGEFGFETFSSKGFVTFTGNSTELTEMLDANNRVAPVPPDVEALCLARFGATPEEDEDAWINDAPVGLTRPQLLEMVDALDPDLDHDTWLRVGMALHHETAGRGFDIWHDWSKRGTKYPGRDLLQARWGSFGKSGGRKTTARSLIKLAHANGVHINAVATADEFEALVDDTDDAATPRFHFEPVHAFSSATALPWMVKNVLPKAALAVVYGASGSGKSFAVLDLTMAIAMGIEWRNLRVKQGRVAYIAAEGADGFRKRIAAYAKRNEVDLATVPMTVLNAAPNLMEKQDAADIVRGVRAAGGADIIVVDTLAQTMPGANENAGEDVGKALGYCKFIHAHTGAMVLLIHHSGKDASKGARGWSGLRAACDAELEVVREINGGRYLRLSKNKDGEDGLEWGFALEVVELGVDEDMDAITSCVVVEANVPVKGLGIARKLGSVEVIVNEVVLEFAQAQRDGIEVEAVLVEAVRRMDLPAEGKRDTRRMRAKQALDSLCRGDDAPYFLEGDCLSVV